MSRRGRARPPVAVQALQKRLRGFLHRLAQEYPGLTATPAGKRSRRIHVSACMVFLTVLLLCMTYGLGFFRWVPALGELYETDAVFLSLAGTACVSLVLSGMKAKKLTLSLRFLPAWATLMLLSVTGMAAAYLIVRQPPAAIAKEGVYYFVPPLCFFALLQYPEIRREDFPARLSGLIVFFSALSSLAALAAFLLYTFFGVNLLGLSLTPAAFRGGTIRLKVGGTVLYTGILLSCLKMLRGEGTKADLINLALGLLQVIVINKTRTAAMYLLAVFLMTLLTEKKVHWLIRLLCWFLIGFLLVVSVILSDSLTTSAYALFYGDAGIAVRFRAIRHYLTHFYEYPLTGVGLISASKSLPGWQVLYGPYGQYYRSDVGLIGLMSQFGMLGLLWAAGFLWGGFRRARKSRGLYGRFVWMLMTFLTVSLVNLSFLDPGRCMYLFIVYAYLEILPSGGREKGK